MRTDGMQTIANTSGVTSIPVASTGAAYTDKFPLSNAVKIGLVLTATSSGAVDILVALQMSIDGTNFAKPTGASDIVNLTDEVAHYLSVADSAIPGAKWGRLSFTGQGANHASTVVAGLMDIIRET